MFKACRKYGSVILLTLMSMVTVCLVVDEVGDSRQLDKQATMLTDFALMVDDIDLDEIVDDEVVFIEQILDDNAFAKICATEIAMGKAQEGKCPLALLLGQVRRYSPRSCIADSHNYTHLSITRSGVDLLHATFLLRNITIT